MNENCGCCEGVEQITPVSTVNRPGLSALLYRIGKHSTFLETMIARLSSFSFEPPPEGDGQPPPDYPLRGLTTREANDAAIAFLDAWAMVADVLTFYQERIANEGFLRTATELRSVLELARLLGYAPRPGVAASTYLAYTLDDGSEVTIPAGTRAQSVPGPGELPQAFETAEDIYARAEWNTLQPRMTRPQFARQQLFIPGMPLYLKGTATNLKVNDPLLIDFDNQANQRVFRVTKVEPDQAADHTKVTVQDWMMTFVPAVHLGMTPPTHTFATPPPAQSVNDVREIIARHKRAEDFNINAKTQTARTILSLLEDLESQLRDDLSGDDLREMIEEKLPELRDKHRQAREGNFTKLMPWIGSIVSELEEVSESIPTAPATIPDATAPDVANSPPPETPQSSLVELSRVLKSLGKPQTPNPASKQQLGRSLTSNFDPASDALPKLLITLHPELEPMLYRAWGNVPVSAPVVAQVYALRTRASVFGNNAPRINILDGEGNIERQEEWTLFRSKSVVEPEHFSINVALSPNDTANFTSMFCDINITIQGPGGATPLTGSTKVVLANDTVTITMSDNIEVVSVHISNLNPDDPLQSTFDIRFTEREIQVLLDLSDMGRTLRASNMGCCQTATDLTSSQEAGGEFNTTGFFRLNATMIVEGNIDAQGVVSGEPSEDTQIVSLDATFEQILPGSWAVLERPSPLVAGESTLLIRRITSVSEGTRADYGVTAKGTQLQLDGEWISPESDDFNVIRSTTVMAQSEPLALAEEPLHPVLEDMCGNRIELANLVSGLEPGRWLIITGERTDIVPQDTETRVELPVEKSAEDGGLTGAAKPIIPGVTATELVMLGGIEQGYDESVPGDSTHTTLILAKDLDYCYKRDTVRIYGNVVRATHGETRNEVLGSGDAGRPAQAFTLRQSPLTYLSAPTPSGVESSLQVRVNDILWHETDSFAGLMPKDRKYTTKTDDKDQTTILFGNGREGARLQTGVENVKAVYRTGIGRGGNVKAQQISIVVTKPLGVKEVINPLAATGGADREDRDHIRRNAPLAVTALDRLISTQDYEKFARTFAGIGKASAVRLTDGQREVVHLTIAGTDDIPISVKSDLYKNLREAFRRYGDPFQPVKIATRFLKLLVVSAKVRIHPDYIFEAVEPQIRQALRDRFSFNRRELGQDVVLSEVVATMQAVEGVVYVDVDLLDSIKENITASELLELSETFGLNTRIRVDLAQVDIAAADEETRIRPAQLALLNSLVPETLVLMELK
ncbi:MAG: putative baseplate assembly protein [Pyrinomonadaceae bacterium]